MVNGSPHSDSSRKMQSVVAIAAITPLLFLIVVLVLNALHDAQYWWTRDRSELRGLSEQRHKLEKGRDSLEQGIAKLNNDLSDFKKDIERKKDDLLQKTKELADPGPCPPAISRYPPFWHPFDQRWWRTQKDAFDLKNRALDNLKREIQKEHDELQQVVGSMPKLEGQLTDVQNKLPLLEEEIARRQLINTWKSYLSELWNHYIAPLLHLMLIWWLVRISLRIALRLLLILGLIGEGCV